MISRIMLTRQSIRLCVESEFLLLPKCSFYSNCVQCHICDPCLATLWPKPIIFTFYSFAERWRNTQGQHQMESEGHSLVHSQIEGTWNQKFSFAMLLVFAVGDKTQGVSFYLLSWSSENLVIQVALQMQPKFSLVMRLSKKCLSSVVLSKNCTELIFWYSSSYSCRW